MFRRVALTASVGLFLLVSACGGDSSPAAGPAPTAATSAATATGAAPSTPTTAPTSDPASPDQAFCTGFDANGGTLASIGEPPSFYPKEQLVAYAEETLAVMKGLRPPAPIAAAWTTYQQFQTRLLAAAKALGAGQRLSGQVPGAEAVGPAYTAIGKWISTNC